MSPQTQTAEERHLRFLLCKGLLELLQRGSATASLDKRCWDVARGLRLNNVIGTPMEISINKHDQGDFKSWGYV